MLHMISARCVARDSHSIVPGPLERACWRQFVALWGDCKKSRIAPLNAIIIILTPGQALLALTLLYLKSGRVDTGRSDLFTFTIGMYHLSFEDSLYTCIPRLLETNDFSVPQSMNLSFTVFEVYIKGSQPEWCISSMMYSTDTPFWSETLNIINSLCFCEDDILKPCM